MKAIDAILTKLETDLLADIPALVSAKGLQAFDDITIGSSKNPQKVSLHIYTDNGSKNKEVNTYTAIIQLQLYKITELAAAKYTDVVVDYMEDYAPSRLGMTNLEELNFDSWPIEGNQTTFVYIECTWIDYRDSCD